MIYYHQRNEHDNIGRSEREGLMTSLLLLVDFSLILSIIKPILPPIVCACVSIGINRGRLPTDIVLTSSPGEVKTIVPTQDFPSLDRVEGCQKK